MDMTLRNCPCWKLTKDLDLVSSVYLYTESYTGTRIRGGGGGGVPAVPIFKCHLPGNFLRLNFSSKSLVLRKMMTYSRPKLSDFYTLF